MAPKRPFSPSTSLPPSNIYKSSPILDRSSCFLALYSPILSTSDLCALPEIRSATHRMTAWRKPSRSQHTLISQRPLLETGHDDDGEKHGGKTLEKVFMDLDVEGAVVVARWYGGVMLGPVRFDHIKACAREAIIQFIDEEREKVKKVKIAGESRRRREDLQRILPERDRSVSVLRDLLAEKQGTTSSQAVDKQSPAKVLDYAALPLATLENLERARDATIGWILKQIERVEAAQGQPSDGAKPIHEDFGGQGDDLESPRRMTASESAEPAKPMHESNHRAASVLRAAVPE